MHQAQLEEVYEDSGVDTARFCQGGYNELTSISDNQNEIQTNEISFDTSLDTFNGKIYQILNDTSMMNKYFLYSWSSKLFADIDTLKNDLEKFMKDDPTGDVTSWSELHQTTINRLDELEILMKKAKLQAPDSSYISGEISKLDTHNPSVIVDIPSTSYSTFTEHDWTTLNARLTSLEKAIGPVENSAPLATIIKRLSDQTQLLENGVADTILQKLSTLKTELNTIISGKTATSQREMKLLENAMMIHEIHQKLSDIDDIYDDLPLIVSRLKTVDTIHQHGVNITSRIQTLEQHTDKLSNTLKSNETVLTDVKEGMKHNFESIEKSMKLLNERMLKLEKGIK